MIQIIFKNLVSKTLLRSHNYKHIFLCIHLCMDACEYTCVLVCLHIDLYNVCFVPELSIYSYILEILGVQLFISYTVIVSCDTVGVRVTN